EAKPVGERAQGPGRGAGRDRRWELLLVRVRSRPPVPLAPDPPGQGRTKGLGQPSDRGQKLPAAERQALCQKGVARAEGTAPNPGPLAGVRPRTRRLLPEEQVRVAGPAWRLSQVADAGRGA